MPSEEWFRKYGPAWAREHPVELAGLHDDEPDEATELAKFNKEYADVVREAQDLLQGWRNDAWSDEVRDAVDEADLALQALIGLLDPEDEEDGS